MCLMYAWEHQLEVARLNDFIILQHEQDLRVNSYETWQNNGVVFTEIEDIQLDIFF